MRENNTKLNWIYSEFQTAAILHNAIHTLILHYPDMSNGLTIEQKATKEFITQKAIEDLEKLRDIQIESAIASYKIYKENPNASGV